METIGTLHFFYNIKCVVKSEITLTGVFIVVVVAAEVLSLYRFNAMFYFIVFSTLPKNPIYCQ